ncbi:hypothetical protein ABPG77_010447 [Micractinium sp. CCAP 211/92]
MQCQQTTMPTQAFSASLRELAATGQAPVVLQDCLRWLALRGLTTPRLFAGTARSEDRKLAALRHLYDTGRRPLRSKSCRDKEPHVVASLLLLWLRSLPEPLFPAALVPELVDSQQSDYYDERVASVRALLKRSEPYVVEALFPLFELLHHYWINQADRDSCLQELGRMLAPAVFGSVADHGLPAEDEGLLSDTVEMLIAEYRPLFTQPFNLRRYEADVARQAQQAEAQRAEVASAATLPLGSPLLTPIRCERLSVMAPEGSSPFSDCCATPLPASPVSLFLAATTEASGAPAGISPPFSPLAASPRQPPISLGLAAFQEPLAVHDTHDGASLAEDQHLEEAFSELLESTVSSMLFDLPLLPAVDAALAAGAACAASPCEQPGSPVAVVREAACDAGDSSDGSDCDVPMGCAQHPFAWAPPVAAHPVVATR